MNTKILEKIGMTEGEIRVYFALLELGSSTTGDIIDKSHITSSKVYQILERLEQKGLVSHIIKKNIKNFQVADPKRLLDYMKEKKKELEIDTEKIKQIIPALKIKREKFHDLQETTLFQGVEGLQTSMEEFIQGIKKGEEYVVFGANQTPKKQEALKIRNFHLKREKDKVSARLIYNSKNRKEKERFKSIKLTQIRFVDHILPSSTAVCKDKVLIITFGEDSRQVLIKSKQIADSFYQFFESMWKISNP